MGTPRRTVYRLCSFRAGRRYSKVLMSWIMAAILDADWSTRPRTTFRRSTPGGTPGPGYQVINLGFTVFWRALSCFLAGRKMGKKAALLSSGPSPVSLPSILRPCATSECRTQHNLQTHPTLTNLFRHNNGNQRISASYHTTPTRCPRARTRHAHITRDKGQDERPPTVP